ncbi:TerB family tellurite resistance protein [Pedobacter sp. LMG 31464]|uniref:TerB family tellurite resistance protein n=1 Tax=Pedobacter planticolens TaxID=2679964 RepID=A0A923DZ28_9SPHI|nr:TerB family tellurite resistance protein [Pedobacter planticolens]MBB2145765.1 TerB family tellurite resistance protein [Pedobacter planticolens]
MKRIRKIGFLGALLFLLCGGVCFGQSSEATQLLLNVEKLSQLKNILSDMKKGYTIVSSGYRSVKNIAEGSFSLHEVFLDGLMLVSPEVKKYARVADIISYQKNIVSEYKRALKGFRAADVFSADELSYVSLVYENLFDQSLQNLDDLAMVITSSKLRMSDDERLRAIDRIFLDTQDKLMFLRNFNSEANMLLLQKKKQKKEISQFKGLY